MPNRATQHCVTAKCLRRLFLGLLTCGALLLANSPTMAAEHHFAFDVHLSLSTKAAARLAAAAEGIIVSASFYGDPVPAAEKHADQVGRIDLGV